MKNAASHKSSLPTRMERDTMGELAVPADAYYGVQTARAIENFPISPCASHDLSSGRWG